MKHVIVFMAKRMVSLVVFSCLVAYNGYAQLNRANTTQANHHKSNYQRIVSGVWALHHYEIRGGTLWGSGFNGFGQLGDGTNTNRTAPVQIGTDDRWSLVAAALGHTVAIKTDGTLWSWGVNNFGQLGNGTNTASNIPIQVGSGNNWTAASSGESHTIALRADGTLWAWGNNLYGQVGNGTTTPPNVPIQIGSDNKWIKVFAGTFHSLGLKSDGTLWAWGRNLAGQVGNGTTVNVLAPVQVGSDQNWIGMAGGNNFTLAVKNDGTLWEWPFNGLQVPVQRAPGNDWATVSSGGHHRLATKANGTLWAWGIGNFGQLGDGTGIFRSDPVQVGSEKEWVGVSGGQVSTYGVKANGEVYAWGNNEFGQLGMGTVAGQLSPSLIRPSSNGWLTIDAGTAFNLGVKTNGTLWAWGVNLEGQLGDGTNLQRNAPVQVGVDANWVAVSAGEFHSLGLRVDGTLWSWGDNDEGELGNGTQASSKKPRQIALGNTWRNISAGFNHSLAIRSDGTLWAWGGDYGLLPSQIGTSNNWVSVSAGILQSAALRGDGTLWAAGGLSGSPQFQQVGNTNDWAGVAATARHNLALKTNGTLWAWGANESFQLGLGINTPFEIPSQVGGVSNLISMSTGLFHSLGLTADGNLWTWGGGAGGQLGVGNTTQLTTPALAPGNENSVEISAGGIHSVRFKVDRNEFCAAGNNSAGQLGNNSTTSSNTFTCNSCNAPVQPVITGPVNVCHLAGTNANVNFSVTPDPEVVSYEWSFPSTIQLVGGQNTPTLTVTVSSNFTVTGAEQIRVKATNACGASSTYIHYLVAQVPGSVQPISGPTSSCGLIGDPTGATYSVGAVAGASNYEWFIPAGTTIAENNGNSIRLLFSNAFVPGFLSVRATNSCGVSALRGITINRTDPPPPGIIIGYSNVCMFMPTDLNPAGTPAVYNVLRSPDITSYLWTVPPGVNIISQTSNATMDILTVNFTAAYNSGNISVAAVNGCGTSQPRVKALSRLNPGTPGAITVQESQSCPDRQYTFSLPSMPSNATSITWTIPPGASIVSGQGTASLVVAIPPEGLTGPVRVQAVNGCGASGIRTRLVNLLPCPPPPPISRRETEMPGLEILKVELFPNPFRNSFNVMVKAPAEKENVYLTVRDNLGRKIYGVNVKSGQWQNIGIGHAPGIYFLEARQGNERVVKKVVRQ